SACPPASPSSQQLDHLPQCLRRDLAADAHPRTATELDVDNPGSFDPPARRPALRLRNDLDRHQRVALRLRRWRFRQHLPPPFEQLICVQIVPARHGSDTNLYSFEGLIAAAITYARRS